MLRAGQTSMIARLEKAFQELKRSTFCKIFLSAYLKARSAGLFLLKEKLPDALRLSGLHVSAIY